MTAQNNDNDTAPQQMRPITRQSAEKLRAIREELSAAHNGELFEDSTEIIRQMREDRAHHLGIHQ
jgi:hypothetical protein